MKTSALSLALAFCAPAYLSIGGAACIQSSQIGVGNAAIDGRIGPEEWSQSVRVTFSYPATEDSAPNFLVLYLMHDECHWFVAVASDVTVTSSLTLRLIQQNIHRDFHLSADATASMVNHTRRMWVWEGALPIDDRLRSMLSSAEGGVLLGQLFPEPCDDATDICAPLTVSLSSERTFPIPLRR